MDPGGSGAFTGVWLSVDPSVVGFTNIRMRRYAVPASVPAFGNRILLSDNPNPTRRHLSFVSKDRTISTTSGVSPNPVVDGAVLQVFNGSGSGESVCFALPASNWTATGPADSPTYRYRDLASLDGPCKRARLRGGRSPVLEASCRATQQPIAYSLDEPTQGSVVVSLATGTATYCALFGGTVLVDSATERKFRAQNADPPPACPVPPVACP
jgi:hypothetical protein